METALIIIVPILTLLWGFSIGKESGRKEYSIKNEALHKENTLLKADLLALNAQKVFNETAAVMSDWYEKVLQEAKK